MKSAQADGRDFFAGAPKSSVEHVALAGSGRLNERDLSHGGILLLVLSGCNGKCAGNPANCGGLEKVPAFHSEAEMTESSAALPRISRRLNGY